MSEPAKKLATYDDLYRIPENMVGEIIGGELVVTPRPTPKHSQAITALGGSIVPPFASGRGGPGGWIILIEPEVGLGEQIVVPDLAGWKRERFPFELATNWISVCPDWVCEVLSPKTFRIDRTKKMGIYAEHGVSHIWLIDPFAETVEVFKLETGRWFLLAAFSEEEKMRVEPFEEIEIDLAELWLKP